MPGLWKPGWWSDPQKSFFSPCWRGVGYWKPHHAPPETTPEPEKDRSEEKVFESCSFIWKKTWTLENKFFSRCRVWTVAHFFSVPQHWDPCIQSCMWPRGKWERRQGWSSAGWGRWLVRQDQQFPTTDRWKGCKWYWERSALPQQRSETQQINESSVLTNLIDTQESHKYIPLLLLFWIWQHVCSTIYEKILKCLSVVHIYPHFLL